MGHKGDEVRGETAIATGQTNETDGKAREKRRRWLQKGNRIEERSYLVHHL